MTQGQRTIGVGDGSEDLTVLWASGRALMLPDKRPSVSKLPQALGPWIPRKNGDGEPLGGRDLVTFSIFLTLEEMGIAVEEGDKSWGSPSTTSKFKFGSETNARDYMHVPLAIQIEIDQPAKATGRQRSLQLQPNPRTRGTFHALALSKFHHTVS